MTAEFGFVRNYRRDSDHRVGRAEIRFADKREKVRHRALRDRGGVADQPRRQIEVEILGQRYGLSRFGGLVQRKRGGQLEGWEPACVAGVPSSLKGASS